MSEKSIEQQTGWKRPHPFMILQEPALLVKITKFNYDLEDMQFVRYFESRTGIRITACECGWEEVKKHWANHNLDLKVDTAHWSGTRARIQDCWEIYNSEKYKEEEWD